MFLRLKKVAKKFIIITAVGAVYLIICLKTPFKIPCPFYYITGLYCPSCGITRMALALFRFDIRTAFLYNSAAFLILPVLAIVLLKNSIIYIKNGSRSYSKTDKIIIWILILILITYGILRNIPAFYYLRPVILK